MQRSAGTASTSEDVVVDAATGPGPRWLRLFAGLAALFPEGNRLPPRVWERRHEAIVRFALVQSVMVFAFGVWRGLGAAHVAVETVSIAGFALYARFARASQSVRSTLATISLISASAVLVHQAGGVTEWHFHFFVMVGLITLYQDWVPFAVAIVFVVVHHGLLGTIDPQGVYGTPEAIRAPWHWVLLHGGFVLAAAAVHVVAWRLSEEQGSTDPVTGLANRLGFTDLVDHEAERGEPIAVLYLDLDGFKAVNDSLGHGAGDEVLRQAGLRLRDAVRASGGRPARLGGDEFAVLLSGAHAAAATRLAERILHTLAEPVFLADHQREIHVRASIGTATGEPGQGGVELLRRADMAMYSAKRAGGGRVTSFDDGLEVAQRVRSELAGDLRDAVARGQMRLLYQPTIDMASGRITGVEALARWAHPVHGTVAPTTFVALAEQTGTIVGIGSWVLDRAVGQAAAWLRQGLDLTIAVNVSARQLDEPDFADHLFEVLDRHGVDPQRLVLELTESVLVRDLDDVARRLEALRRRGVKIAIDDFGTGYSSMSYLRRLPVDVVKIDRSFVREMTAGSTELALVRSIIQLAKTLQIAVVAEGVEESEQADALRALECAVGQGYLWSRPVDPAIIPALVRRHAPSLVGS
jgi:diguanylate cyclase (GGDEF)-like protein